MDDHLLPYLIIFLAAACFQTSQAYPVMFRHIQKRSNELSVDYRFFTSDSTCIPDRQTGAAGITVYLNVMYNKLHSINSIDVCYIRIDKKDIQGDLNNNIDCKNYYDDNRNACAYFEMLMKVLAASHL